ncbi:MAG: HAD hydrolase family protein [Deltaproteobacteria bacterium]|nr:HAD hydrolase family protein [Deltaproteobacteria bacterium]
MSEPAFDLAAVRLVAFDVDGVLTDGRLYLDDQGRELHAFHVRDGMGMALARRDGLLLVALSGRDSPGVRARLQELRVSEIHLGVIDKAQVLSELAQRLQIPLAQTCFVGDDVNDLAALAIAGRSYAPADAHPRVRAVVHSVTRAAGGHGVLREILDAIYQARKAAAASASSRQS